MSSYDTITYVNISWMARRNIVLSGKVSGFYGYVEPNVRAINNIRNTFIQTPEASSYLITFKHNVADFIFNFDSGTDDAKQVIADIYSIKDTAGSEVITTNPAFLQMIGIDTWDDLETMEYISSDIVVGLADYFMMSSIYKAMTDYPCLEIYIGMNLAIIKYNLYMFNMPNLIEEYNLLKTSFGNNTTIDETLPLCFLDENGEFSYTYALQNITEGSHTAIKGFERVFTFIFNSNKNAIFRKTGLNSTFINIDPEEFNIA